MGYNVITNYNLISLEGNDGVFINNSALGVGMAFIFTVIIWFYPGGDKRKKYWFIPLGISCIFLMSIFRLVYLVLYDTNSGIHINQSQQDYFQFAGFLIIFMLWFIWVTLVNKINPFKS